MCVVSDIISILYLYHRLE